MCKVLSLCLVLLSFSLSACFFASQDPDYAGPRLRPASLDEYYAKGNSYIGFREEIFDQEEDFAIKRIYLQTNIGPIVIDYFKRPEESKELILVFPVLGGRNVFENYFAAYFAEHGFDAAVVHRDSDFKNPDNIDRIETLFRNNVIKDRIALDFFENVYKKDQFASFGISRGAINVAMTAGVDARLKYNVLAMGGSDLVKLFSDSKERGIQKFKRRVMAKKNFSETDFYDYLKANIKTDPKFVASYIDANNTLMFLSVFDQSVPIKYGLRLRKAIGRPDTIFLMSGHYSSLAFTQFVKLVPPQSPICLFPFDYVETEAVAFYRRAFARGDGSVKEAIVRVLGLPSRLMYGVISLFK